ncbi:hypothetical protein M413DRAFT_449897 [Hebeloma cylindrosporum]|uniref:Uncharacterized protein n=1 Tax=Hebeloma cylindrosporum TaxID=76867 RepID=A0A0C3BSW2_HEBCY|nr:hypothetical protein M413DRAFT_449897 [Hebeloma cylindrosporum h7]
MGLFSIANGLYWLLTHPIPYESLGLDLHQFVSSCESNSYGDNSSPKDKGGGA